MTKVCTIGARGHQLQIGHDGFVALWSSRGGFLQGGQYETRQTQTRQTQTQEAQAQEARP